MQALGIILVLLLLALVFVMYIWGGRIFNRVFRGKTLSQGKLEMSKKLKWTTTETIEDTVARIRSDLALTDKPKFATSTYTLKVNRPDALVIAYGKQLGSSFEVQVTGKNTATGSAGRFEVIDYTLVDGMPVGVDKVVALRDRICRIVEQAEAKSGPTA